MKKRRFVPILCLLSSFFITSCAEETSSADKESVQTSETIKTYLISFYVDQTLYRTAKVDEGMTVSESTFPEGNPKKEGYSFVRWYLTTGEDFVLDETKVYSNLDVHAEFKLNEVTPPVDDENYSVTDVKDPTKTYSLVIGWYGKTETSAIDESNMTLAYKNIKTFLTYKGCTESYLNDVTVRQYGDSETNVSALGQLVNADSDVDLLFGVGKNITSSGQVETVRRIDDYPIGTTTRSMAILKESEYGSSLFDFLKTETGRKLFDTSYTLTSEDIAKEYEVTPPVDDLSVTDVKDPTKTYSLVIGWYGKTSTSAIDENNMLHAYRNIRTYLVANGMSEDDLKGVTVRQYGDSETNVSALGQLVNADSDVDLLFGVGKNITSTGQVETVEIIDDYAINETARTIALLKESQYGRLLFDFLKTEDGRKFFDTTFTYQVQ